MLDIIRKNDKYILIAIIIVSLLSFFGIFLKATQKYTASERAMISTLETRSQTRLDNLDDTLEQINIALKALPAPPIGESVDKVEVQQFNFNGDDTYVVLLDPALKIPLSDLQAFQFKNHLYRLYSEGGQYYLSKKSF
ncbi:hypothetical protein UA32_12150 [Photobacterium angustum]|uniref:Uncharacterized protein n=1 Tax=Photobacterium angustum TaxID=661 RepID=A0ABX5GYH4_PHOAN|nr:hypothetical protein [Photobacterium angustum]KJG37707.1 hypothetical protein UA32_12150 [Photobacterium angustum]PSX03961.1 hypothetical protein C0W27_20930 [Photobacterium angustum]